MPANQRLLIIGWDAADWNLIDPLMAQGKMPNLKRLVEAGVRSDLATLEPTLSPILWSSIATGKTADKHGILNFVEPNPAGGGVRIAASTTRRTKALWNILTQAGLKVNAVSWYASHPAEPISGACVTNLFQEGEPADASMPWALQAAAVHPESLSESLAACRVATSGVKREEVLAMIPMLHDLKRGDERPRALAKQLARMKSVHQATLSILRGSTDWNCTMVFYETIDTIGHHFMQFVAPRMPHVHKDEVRWFGGVMNRTYELHDRMLGELLEAAGPGTTVLLLSDHGFHSDHRRPTINTDDAKERAAMEAMWHRPFGVLAMSGPGVKRGAAIVSSNLLDIAPTALALLGLPAGRDMDGRALLEALEPDRNIPPIESWDAVEGNAAMHPAEMRSDPFESQDALQQLVDLGYMAAPSEGVQAQLDLVRRETRFNLAVTYSSTGRPHLALPIMEELFRECPGEKRYQSDLAKMQYLANRFAECVEGFQKILAENPQDVDAGLMLASALIQLNRMDEAKKETERLVKRLGSQGQYALALGNLLCAFDKFEEALRLYQQAGKFEPDNPMVHLGLARASLGLKRFDDAVDHTIRAAELHHLLPEAHFLLGVALAWLEDFPHARQSFEVALSMQPNLVDTHRFMTLVCGALNLSEPAAKHAAQADLLLKQVEGVDAARAEKGAAKSPPVRVPAWGWQAFEQRLRSKPNA
ncbi:MAG: alkaline phosphatase family protein [Planctomycetes bacterium]|nr:alkaline phosphatase family protein [Planctomycetota bacterium]